MVDFEKAFDSVVWPFIKKSSIKLKFNFGSSITWWISAFIVTLSSVCQLMVNILNGSMSIFVFDMCQNHVHYDSPK